MSQLKTKLDRIWNRKGVSNPLRKALWQVINGKYSLEIIPKFIPRRIKRRFK